MKKIVLAILTITTLLTACIGEDFIEEVPFFDPEFTINSESSVGIDSLLTGDTVFYMTTFLNTEGKEMDVDVSWESSRTSVATIDNSGKLIALQQGATNIKATSNGLTAEILVVVQGFERIEIGTSSTSLVMGDQLQLSSKYFDRMNVLTNANLSWRSSNLGVVSIDSTGNLTAISFGAATITASFNGITSNSIEINVVNIERIEATVLDTFIAVGQQLTASAEYFDQTGSQVPTTFSWNSSNTAVATVSSSGTITAITKGRTQITAMSNGITSNIISIEIIDDTTEAINIDISSSMTSIIIRSTLQFSGIVRNINGTVLPNETLQWTSSNPAVLSIDGNGLSTGVNSGSSTISATTVNGKTSNLIVITVVNVERIALAIPDSIVIIGQQRPTSAVYFDPAGVQTPTTFSWSSSNTSIATINNSGVITGVGVGVAQITAMANGVTSNSKPIEVINDTTVAASVNVSSSGTSVMVGGTLPFSVEVRNINGKILPNQLIQWMSSDPVVLSVDANGLATGATVGSSTVTAASGGIQSNGVNVLVAPAVTTIRTGNFVSANGYNVSGSVDLRLLTNNSLQLEFSNFSSSNSGALYIYLGNSANSISGAVQVQQLNFRNGSFNVPVPSSVAGINTYDYVIIWCQGIGQSFGAAMLN